MAKKTFASASVDKLVKAVLDCIAKPDYLTICELDEGGSAADIDVSILRALRKGTKVAVYLQNSLYFFTDGCHGCI